MDSRKFEGGRGQKIRVLMADDHNLIRQAIAETLERDAQIEVVAQAADGLEALRLAEQLSPDVILLDMEMPNMGGAEAITMLLEQSPASKIIILTVFDDHSLMRHVVAKGAAAYLIKSVSRGELIAAVKSVVEAEDRVTLSLTRTALTRPPEAGDARSLSERELEILLFAARGMSNLEIGKCLFLTEGTIKRHLHNAYSKMGVKSRGEATRMALEEGWIAIRDILGSDTSHHE